jgi:hypothetical protein
MSLDLESCGLGDDVALFLDGGRTMGDGTRPIGAVAVGFLPKTGDGALFLNVGRMPLLSEG